MTQSKASGVSLV